MRLVTKQYQYWKLFDWNLELTHAWSRNPHSSLSKPLPLRESPTKRKAAKTPVPYSWWLPQWQGLRGSSREAARGPNPHLKHYNWAQIQLVGRYTITSMPIGYLSSLLLVQPCDFLLPLLPPECLGAGELTGSCFDQNKPVLLLLQFGLIWLSASVERPIIRVQKTY